MTPVAEPLSAEPTPPNGPTSNLGPLDLLSREELLTDTSNSSSSTGEEGESGGPHSFTLVIPKSELVRGETMVHRANHVVARGVGQTVFLELGTNGYVAAKGRL